MVKIVADVGSNFNESLDKAKDYVVKCAEIGVDVVKFQCWEADTLFSPKHPAYEKVRNRLWGLPLEWHRELKELADSIGVEFLTTPTAPAHVEFLEKINIKSYKIASGDLTYIPLLEEINKTGKKVIISTGMATTNEITMAVDLLGNCEEIFILHCISLYPPRWEDVNLRAILTLKKLFPNCKIGFSDHTPGWELGVAAVALGAQMLEKHITESRNLDTPDAKFSLTIDEFKDFVSSVRKVELSLGDGRKVPRGEEIKERFWARRGIYASTDLKAGEAITLSKIKFLRPAEGIESVYWPFVEGKILRVGVRSNSCIKWDDIS